MQHEDNQTGQGTGRFRHGDGIVMGGVTHSIRPGMPCPATVPVLVLSNGSYRLVGYPDGEPAAFVIAEDAGPFRQRLAVAFGSRP